jgi:hypothetical protein
VSRLNEAEQLSFPIRESDPNLAKQRLDIYQNAYQQRLIEALTSDFPVTRKLAGQQQWNQITCQYLNDYRPNSETLAQVGYQLASFLNETTWPNTPACLADIAAFEWSLVEAFYSNPHAPTQSIREILEQSHDPGQLQLKLAPHILLQESQWPLDQIYENESTFPADTSYFLFFHRDRQAYYRRLMPHEWQIIHLLRQTRSLTELIEQLMNENLIQEDSAANIVSFLETCERDNILSVGVP